MGPAVLRPLMRVMGIGPDPESAPEAWQRIEDHFARYLKDWTRGLERQTAGRPLSLVTPAVVVLLVQSEQP